MKKDEQKVFEDLSLRQKAEKEIENLHVEKVIPPENLIGQKLSEGELQKLFHELEVHQIELEMQNNELRLAKEEAKILAEKFISIYDFSPTGYFTLEADATILQLNFSGAKMLGSVRSKLVASNFRLFVSQETLPVMVEFLKNAFHTRSKQSCEINLVIQDKLPVFLHLEGIVSEDNQNCLVTAVDITARKQMEDSLEANYSLLRIAGKTARFGGWVLDLYEKKVIWSDEVAAIHELRSGYSPSLEESIKFYAPEWRNKITKDINECVKKGIPFDEDLELITANGNRIWVRTIGEAFQSNGKFTVHGSMQDITERKQTEKSLQKSVDMLSLMMKYTPVYTFIKEVTSTKSITLDASENFQQMLGISSSEMIGKAMDEIFPAEFAAKMTVDDWAVCASGKIFNQVEELNERYYRTIKFPISRGDNNLLAGYSIDISDQKQAEKKLRESEALFRSTFDQSPVGKVLASLDSRFIRCNSAFCDFLGYSEVELIGRSISEFTFPEDSELGQKAKKELLEGKRQTVKLQKRYIRKDGRVIWGEISVSVVRDAENNPMYFLPIIQDITERMLTEEALRRSEIKYRRLHETMMDGFVYIDMNGKFKEFNDTYLKMLGYVPDEMLKLTYQEVTPPQWIEIEERIIKDQIIPRGYSDVYEKEYIRKDGTLLSIELRVFLLKNENNENEGMWAIVRDITERKLAQQALKENEVRLKALNATKDKFFSIIAHDLRSPFNGILGFSTILYDQIKEKNYNGIEEYARIVKNSAQRALSLLMNLLEWSRSQTGLEKFSPEYVEIGILINEVANLFVDMAQQKSIELSIELHSKVIAFGDKEMLGSILRNLISNAIKFTNPGGHIVISAERKPDEILFSVSDNGVGMKKDALEQIFRIDSSSSTKGTNNEKGTGLGLILCKEFVEKHEGKIWAESEDGKGSTFFFSIPSKQMN